MVLIKSTFPSTLSFPYNRNTIYNLINEINFLQFIDKFPLIYTHLFHQCGHCDRVPMESNIITEFQCECSIGIVNVAFNESTIAQIVCYSREKIIFNII